METAPYLHLCAELRRLDLLLHRAILRLRASYQLALDEFRGLYISDEQVDSLVNRAVGPGSALPGLCELAARTAALRAENMALAHPNLPWCRLVADYRLSNAEQDVLLLAAAPEIDAKYETIYAYLNNDVTRRWPTFELALRVCAEGAAERLALRRALMTEAPLLAGGLLEPLGTADRPGWPAAGFALAPGLGHALLGLAGLPPALAACAHTEPSGEKLADLPLDAELSARLACAVGLLRSNGGSPALILEGQPGAGRRRAAAALCAAAGLALLCVDLAAARRGGEPPVRLARLIGQQRCLGAAAVLLHVDESCYDGAGAPLAEIQALATAIAHAGGPLLLACPPGARWRELVGELPSIAFSFGDGGFAARRRVWMSALSDQGAQLSAAGLDALAERFALTPGQIARAAAEARAELILRPSAATDDLAGTLFAAARTRAGQSLGDLATRARLAYTWDDLVLPPATLGQIRDVAAAIRHRRIVYERWGFAAHVAAGYGPTALFAGASGTGKTMAAAVIAGDLGLDLYTIDLSGVVSKYIGETEKNLERIFRAAASSSAILFFDEADALFGKRSEVKDAHDRYANIEVAYLLQRLERHDGPVILASNLRKNIDEAFARRLHYLIEFPQPDEAQRLRLWRGMFPPQAPLAGDADLPFLARQFALTGGDIRNIALDAAFIAAGDGGLIEMQHLVRAMARQLVKQGKRPAPADFQQHYALLEAAL
jgi:hypothetical protein